MWARHGCTTLGAYGSVGFYTSAFNRAPWGEDVHTRAEVGEIGSCIGVRCGTYCDGLNLGQVKKKQKNQKMSE